MIGEALQENANAFSSLCVSIRAISGPLLEYKERFCIVVKQVHKRLVWNVTLQGLLLTSVAGVV